jgi:hypothetical protein
VFEEGSETLEASQLLGKALDMRDIYCQPIGGDGAPAAAASGDTKHSLKFVNGVMQVAVDGADLQPPPSFRQYVSDLFFVDGLHHNGPARTFCLERGQILEQKFEVYKCLNKQAEDEAIEEPTEQRSLTDVHRVDTNVLVNTAATAPQVVRYIRQIVIENSKSTVYKDPKGAALNIEQVFSTVKTDGHDLTAETVSVQGIQQYSTELREQRFA